MEIAEICYHLGLNIRNMSATDIGSGSLKILFEFETEEEDYYIYDRLEDHLRFDIPELQSVKLISMH